MSLLGTVGGYAQYLILACFCSFQLQLRGEKDAVIAVDTCLFEISYNVDSLEVKGPVQLTWHLKLTKAYFKYLWDTGEV